MPDSREIENLKSDRGRLVAALTEAGATVSDSGATQCPFHKDTQASGSIHQTDGGTWLFTCHRCTWNDDKNSGDVIDVTRRVHGLDFRGACARLGLNGRVSQETHKDGQSRPVSRRGDDGGTEAPDRFAKAAHAALMADLRALEHLWRTRGVDRTTAERFRVGITGAPGSRFWTLPIADVDGRVVAVKAHRADGQSQKSWWMPKGVKRSRLFPVDLEPKGQVWLCPGELKALAVIACGRSAVGITSGEGCEKSPADLPPEVFELLRGREVPIPGDDDATGAAWAEHGRQQLADEDIAARLVDLELDRNAGLKDVGDWVTRQVIEDAKEPQAVAAALDAAWKRSDPWYGTGIGELWASPRTWQPATYVPTGLRGLDAALGGGLRTGGTHLFSGKTGHAKSQLAATIAVNAARHGIPVGFFSLEMSAVDIAQLGAAQLGTIPRRALFSGRVAGTLGQQLRRVCADYGGIPLRVLDDARWPNGLDRNGLARLVADGVKRFGWRLVVVDYLGLLAPLETDRDPYTTDLRNSTALRRLAREFDVAVVVVAALRKGATKQNADQLGIDDLLGAGRLAYDAESVAYVRREAGDTAGLVKVRIKKSRFAPTFDNADLEFRWFPRTGTIVDGSYEATDVGYDEADVLDVSPDPSPDGSDDLPDDSDQREREAIMEVEAEEEQAAQEDNPKSDESTLAVVYGPEGDVVGVRKRA